MIVNRLIALHLTKAFEQFPFVTVTGPRQSGKTTLCRSSFPELKYVNLETPDQREFAKTDPRGFLKQVDDGAIIDEVQRVPELVSYLQVHADERNRNGQFVLTGSQHFGLSRTITQSLSGRTRMLSLLPYTIGERRSAGGSNVLEEILYTGFYPRIFDQNLEPSEVYADYYSTYIERDVRQLTEIRNVSNFERFVRLCAGRVGQITDLVKLGSDTGVSHTTARNWLDILEASFIVFRLYPYSSSLRRQMVKSPKLFFYDVGLASYLIGIEQVDQLVTHPLRGALFENMIVVEALKYRFNSGRRSNLAFFRDKRGLECDLLLEMGTDLTAVEIKSGATIPSNIFTSLNKISKLESKISTKFAVYGGDQRQHRSDGLVVPYDEIYDELNRLEVDKKITKFVHEKHSTGSDGTLIEIIEMVINKYARPIIREIQEILKGPDLMQVFIHFNQRSQLRFKNHRSDNFHFVDHRESVKEFFGESGLNIKNQLSPEHPLLLVNEFPLKGSRTNKSTDKFVVGINWTFDDRGFTQTIEIDGHVIDELSDRIVYQEADIKKPEVSRICANISQAILNRLERQYADMF